MRLKIDTKDGPTKVHLNERLTFSDYERVRSLAKELQDMQPARHIQVHVDGLDFIDSAGVGMLLIVQEEVAKTGHRLSVHGARGQVLRVLTIAELNKVLDLRP